MIEIIFLVEDDPEGGYTAQAIGEAIFTQGETKEELQKMIRDAVRCHFDGEEVIITEARNPVVKIVAYNPTITARIPGSWRDQVIISEDFDESLPLEILAGFTGTGYSV
jgi:antitoxin (DNA-binding transcriptional repressor) of toxin-antitoxin stability system